MHVPIASVSLAANEFVL